MPADAAADPSDEACRHAAICHLSAAVGFLVPLGAVVGPLVAWIVLRDTDPFVDRQGRHAVDINLAFLALELLLAGLLVAWAFGVAAGPAVVAIAVAVVFGLVSLAHLAVYVYAAIQTSEGVDVHVPFRLPLLESR